MSPRRKLLWKLYPFYLLLTLVSIASILFVAYDAHTALGTPRTGDQTAWLNLRVIAISLTVGVLISALGFVVILRISRSLEMIGTGARRFADGQLDFRLASPPSEELAGLAETLNRMAAQLEERINTVTQQRHAQDAILGSMVEGVMAVDKQQAILQINPAAAGLVGSRTDLIIGRSLPEVIRNHNLYELVERTLGQGLPCEGEILFYGTSERSLQVHCTPLRNAAGHGIGALIVFNDITRLRRLERVRRDFVANVSHELKTPLTSIKGFVETLLEGALEDPEEATRFCTIISKQVDRLQAIIEDLLSLSRIEQEVEQGVIPLKSGRIIDVLQAALQSVAVQAAEKNITTEIQCAPEWAARFNAPLLEQVAVNLIDNAIKYSEPGRTVRIAVDEEVDGWALQFTDEGVGIEAAHLNRIFERFYRVDKARSRKAGGTGLGLAIVKHIITAHGGFITVQSQTGKGSTFTVHLPRDPEVGNAVMTNESA